MDEWDGINGDGRKVTENTAIGKTLTANNVTVQPQRRRTKIWSH
jgi:hypothetical protein